MTLILRKCSEIELTAFVVMGLIWVHTPITVERWGAKR
jgi:hypothetical protein